MVPNVSFPINSTIQGLELKKKVMYQLIFITTSRMLGTSYSGINIVSIMENGAWGATSVDRVVPCKREGLCSVPQNAYKKLGQP